VEKTRIASAGYCKPGPIRPPYQVFPEEYAALSRENGRRWKEIRAKYAALGRPAGR
jgi:trans-o-hydroxybenzylidenepyruvate hydratase-aldolase